MSLIVVKVDAFVVFSRIGRETRLALWLEWCLIASTLNIGRTSILRTHMDEQLVSWPFL